MSCVVPVVDYEPPMLRTPPQRVRLLRPRGGTAPRRPAPVPVETAPMRAAAGFADAALRRVLEVIDRRRPLAQLRPLLAAGLVDSLLPAVARQEGRGAAHLRRLRVQPVGTDGSAAEVAATYSRNERTHAIACRVEQIQTPTGVRWQVVALHIG
ncbi:Rv3235 family protein [Mycolicibacterium sphagni]|uniref:Alanine, arginine and proline rich protein n=1 Tax=Mycolicibacterium sphagni TaxID=1786 RepID=A0A255D874_9MYCO|nr:Rv3235 family protein [Mycolicibacterium sphagni]OYN75597.1 hypothetical protein CG716_24580 [Mycolicibacterium sphagni]